MSHLQVRHLRAGAGEHNTAPGEWPDRFVYRGMTRYGPLSCQANRQTGTAGHQRGVTQGFALDLQMVFCQGIKNGIATACLL